MRPRAAAWAAAAGLAALVLAAYADPLFLRRTFIGRDIVPYNLPLEKVVHDAWSRGRVPVWWETVSGGRPLLPNPNAGVFYPPRVALALGGVPFPDAMRIFPVFHWILGGVGMLLAARALGMSGAAAWVASVSFVFSGVMVSEVFYTNFHPGASLLPWSLWALVRPARRAGTRAAGLALVYAAMLAAGDAFSIAMALAAAVLWLALEAPASSRPAGAASLALGLVAAVLIALPQVLATALLAPETRRIIGGITLGEATGFTIPFARLLELAVPFPFGPTASMDLTRDWGTQVFRHFFATFFVGPIALAGLLRARRNAAPGWRLALALTAVFVFLALAGHFVPRAWDRLPSPVPLRYPEKFMLGATFGLALAAGLAVDRLARFKTGGRGFLVAASGLAAAATLAALDPAAAGRLLVGGVAGADRVPELAGMAARETAAALAVAGLLWAATAVAADLLARGGRTPVAAALVLLTGIPVAANRAIAQTADEGAVYPPTAFARRIARADPQGSYRALDLTLFRPPSGLLKASSAADIGGTEYFRQSWNYYTPTLWHRGLVFDSDLDAGDLSRIESLRQYTSARSAEPEAAVLFASLSLRDAIRFRDQAPAPGYREVGGDAFRAWDVNPGALPDLRLATRWREETGPVGALKAVASLGPGEVVIETGRVTSGAAVPGKLRVVERTPERLRLETSSPAPAWLFVLRGDWSYRTVRVDGSPVETRPAQIAFTAVPVPAGAHTIEWREEAPGLEASRWGPLVGIAVLALAAARWRTPA